MNFEPLVALAPPTEQKDTEPKVVTGTPVTTKPLKETKDQAIQTTAPASDQELIKSSPSPSITAETKILSMTKEAIQATAPASDKKLIESSSPPPSITAETKTLPKAEPPPDVVEKKLPPEDLPSETRKSSPDVHTISLGLLTELSNRTRTQRSPSSSEISRSNQAPNPEVLQKQLEGFFNMPLEAIQQANAYGSIEGIISSLIQDCNDLREKTILEDLLSRLAEFKESIPVATTITETAQARRTSLSGKTTELDARLAQRQKKLSFLEIEFSRLSKEEEKLEAQIQLLISQKEKIPANKKHVLADLERNNEDAAKDLEEWRNLESEIKQANVDWLGAKEKLALANVRWKLFKEDLGLGKLNIS
ncbi:uncharacterized protein LOC131183142 [Hevea brasiliensis]|uniref:uncharacterized protein LOC131183142 n=1 Tax=Hevea brasiliensis TaxID=3981 RepID=UPI0025DE9234|nr:uncharacterized protein LOC131183142 [Hevea brasiliensis]